MADSVHEPDPGGPDPDQGLPDSGAVHQDRPSGSHRASRSRPVDAVITDARAASSAEMSGRVRRYTITMAFRMACFLGMIFASGWLRWALLGFAVFLPYIAVVFANQSDQRSRGSKVEPGAPAVAPQLSTGEHVQIVTSEVVEDPGPHRAHQDRSHQPGPPPTTRRDG